MQSKLNSPNLPSKQKFASVFKLVGQISYWVHLVLGITSAVILGLVIFSRRLGTTADNSATTIVSILAQAIAQPQSSPIYEPQQAIETADLFLDLVNTTVLGAHALGTINSLGLLNWITRE